jgi:hypothetical protein
MNLKKKKICVCVCVCVDWTHLTKNGRQWLVSVNTLLSFQVS